MNAPDDEVPEPPVDVFDAPEPARLLAGRQVAFRVGQPQAVFRPDPGAAEPRAGNLTPFELDDDTEETPPTAVPGKLEFGLDWEVEDDDDEVASDEGAAPASEAPAGLAADEAPPAEPPSTPTEEAPASGEVAAVPSSSGDEVPASSEPAAAPPPAPRGTGVPVLAIGALVLVALLLLAWWAVR